MSTQAEHRRLGAVMFTDIVGYTSLTEGEVAGIRARFLRSRHIEPGTDD